MKRYNSFHCLFREILVTYMHVPSHTSAPRIINFDILHSKFGLFHHFYSFYCIIHWFINQFQFHVVNKIIHLWESSNYIWIAFFILSSFLACCCNPDVACIGTAHVHILYWISDCCLVRIRNCCAMPWGEQVTLRWDDNNVRFVLDQTH